MSALLLQVNGASIWVVPSVHFCLPFVDEVHRLCSTEKPEAVVVELGPQTAAAAVAWLRKLGVRSGRGSMPLPVMLGLIKRNHRIRASYRAVATRIQQLTGRELHELPPEVLSDFLNYSSVSLLPLSATDSIIEAMRCALELNCPVYGVDLEDTAERQQKSIMLQDPALAADEFKEYVTRNATFAEQQRDEEIDDRRERVMAARLKGLSEQYTRIVFVCGLAHWKRLHTLLQTQTLRPAPYPTVSDEDMNRFHQVIVEPALAIYHVDTFPVFADVYEARRQNASQPRSQYAPQEDSDWRHGVFLAMLQATFTKRFVSEGVSEQVDRPLEDWEAKSDFEQLLWNFCTVRQRRTPDIFSAFAVAEGCMSESFCNLLAETFMDFAWLKPDDYPDLPILQRSPSPSPSPSMKAELLYREGRTGGGFFVQTLPGRLNLPMNKPITWKWKDAPPPQVPPFPDYGIETWVPTEDLVNAFLFRAARIAREQGADAKIEAFEGSLLDGIDMKATLRSAARGEDQIFVRMARRQRIQASDGELDGFPVLWIFRLMEGLAQDWNWKFSADRLDMLSDGDLSEEWTTAGLAIQGSMITSIAAVTNSHEDEKLSTPDYSVTTETIIGKLSYWPQCCETRTAEWALETGLTRNPVCADVTFDSLSEFYRERYDFDVGEVSWPVTLIRMAIPMAKRSITVVAPDGYRLPPVVYREAAMRSVEIRTVPLSYFPAKMLQRLSHLVWLPILRREYDESSQIDFPVYPEHVQRHFNEPIDKYRHLIPAKWH